MNLLSETLYKNYTNKEHSYDGVKARSIQRMKWLRQYFANGTCKNKLIACGVLVADNE